VIIKKTGYISGGIITAWGIYGTGGISFENPGGLLEK
jgi:hypothetical protein